MKYDELVKQVTYWKMKAEFWQKEAKRLDDHAFVLSNMVCLHPGGLTSDNGGSLHCPLKRKSRRVKPTPPRYDEVFFRGSQELFSDEFDNIDF